MISNEQSVEISGSSRSAISIISSWTSCVNVCSIGCKALAA